MAKQPFLKFFPSDWRSDPALRVCSLAARGLWIEMLAIMHEADPRGSLLISGKAPTPAQLASLVGASLEEVQMMLAELEGAGVFSRKRNGVIYSRRIERDEIKAGRSIIRIGIPKWLRRTILARDGHRCVYCGAESGPFHIDHVRPVIMGGRNTPENLVVACRPCNSSKGAKSLDVWRPA